MHHQLSTKSSLYVEASQDSEAVQRIQEWRVHITKPESVVSSKMASAYSRFRSEDDGVSSHLTSVSRSPLSKGSGDRDRHEKDGGADEYDPEKTPTLRAKRVTKVGRETAHSCKVSPSKASPKSTSARDGGARERNSLSSVRLGTQHIARLTDSQFDRLARATEGPSPPPPTSIPREKPAVPVNFLRPNTKSIPLPATDSLDEDDRRSSFDATGTTLSVLERKASTHIETLDNMIRRHPEKMYQVFKQRPGLMLVILLRCTVEDRISEVNASPSVSRQTKFGADASELKKDQISLLEESLIDLHFDKEDVGAEDSVPSPLLRSFPELEQLGQWIESGQPSCGAVPVSAAGEVPSIVISQHHTGSTSNRSNGTVATYTPSSSITTSPANSGRHPTHSEASEGRERYHDVGIDACAFGGELGSRTETTLREMVHRLEQAGELCSIQQTLIALQDRLMTTNASCDKLGERLSTVSNKAWREG